MDRTPVAATPSFTTTSVDNTLIALWWGECTRPALEDFGRELERLSARHPRGIYVLNVITEETGMPDNAARAYLETQFASMRGRLKATAIVLEKRGIMGTLSRAILNTVLTISKRPFEMGIVGDRSEGAHWLAPRAAQRSERLMQALAALVSRAATRSA
ncbi:MAG TPA: hypothetical protein VHB79_02860 [Polyangiaceae bacterium]|nr:hypothetical protein [Polyangiaceae bacterium]